MAELRKITLDHDCDCGGCACPLLPGEVAWLDERTGAVGCCQPCARDAGAATIDRHEIAAYRASFDLNLNLGVSGGLASC